MSGTSFRLVDRQDSADAALAGLVANDNARPSSGSEWRTTIDRSHRAHQNLDFEGAERELETALLRIDEDLGAAVGETARQVARGRRADTCMALAEIKLEKLDLTGADQLFRSAIGTFPEEERRLASSASTSFRDFASLLGRADAARLAVDLLREPLHRHAVDVGLQNEFGLACVAHAELTGDPETLEEARSAFDAALAAAQKLPRQEARALSVRVQINRAVVLRLLAQADRDQSVPLRMEAEKLLHEGIRLLKAQTGPMSRIDLPRAWDNLGSVLFDASRWDEAIAAFEAARDLWVDEKERARTLANLGLSYGRADRFEEARLSLEDALRAQPEEIRPLARSRTLQYLGDILRLHAEALAPRDPDQSLALFNRSFETLLAAREQRHPDLTPALWAETTASMGMVYQQLRQPDRAVSLYLQALPRLNLKNRFSVANIVAQLFRDSDLVMLYCDMAIKKELLTDIESVMNAHGIARRDWAAAWAEIGARWGVAQTGSPTSAQQATPVQAAPAPSPDRPRLKWLEARQSGETPPAFIMRAYAAEREAGTLHKGLIHREDPSLYRALFKWQGNSQNRFPADLDLPTEAEWNTRQLARFSDDPARLEAVRLAAVARTRDARAGQPPSSRPRGRPRKEFVEKLSPQQNAAGADEIPWPMERWKGSPEELSRKQLAIYAYLRRVWKPFIDETGVLVTRPILAERDAEAALALKGALRSQPLPADIQILSTRELRQGAAAGFPVRAARRHTHS